MFLAEGLNDNTRFGRYYRVIFLVKDPLIASSIVVLSPNPTLQISIPFFTMMYLFVNEARLSP